MKTSSNTFTVPKRRKRQGKTDYKKRLRLLLARKPRLAVRKSCSCITAQIIEYDDNGDKIVAQANSFELKKIGWNYNSKNIPSAYLVGVLIAKKAKANGLKEAILDTGPYVSVKGSKLYAVLKGAIDNGLSIPHSNEILPSADRISGKHIEKYANDLKSDQAAYGKKFSECLKNNADPAQITKVFNEVKNKLIGA